MCYNRCLGVQWEKHYLQARTGFPTAVDVMQELHMLCEIDMKHDKSFSQQEEAQALAEGLVSSTPSCTCCTIAIPV